MRTSERAYLNRRHHDGLCALHYEYGSGWFNSLKCTPSLTFSILLKSQYFISPTRRPQQDEPLVGLMRTETGCPNSVKAPVIIEKDYASFHHTTPYLRQVLTYAYCTCTIAVYYDFHRISPIFATLHPIP